MKGNFLDFDQWNCRRPDASGEASAEMVLAWIDWEDEIITAAANGADRRSVHGERAPAENIENCFSVFGSWRGMLRFVLDDFEAHVLRSAGCIGRHGLRDGAG